MDPKTGPRKRLYISATCIVRATTSSMIVVFAQSCKYAARQQHRLLCTSKKFVTKKGPNDGNKGPISGAKHPKRGSFSSGHH
jgi:hypothetical protein